MSKQWENQWVWIDEQLKSLGEFKKKMSDAELLRKDKVAELEEKVAGLGRWEESVKRLEEQLKENSRLQQFLAQHEIECTKQKLKQEQSIAVMRDELNSLVAAMQNQGMRKSRSTCENNSTHEDFNYSYKKPADDPQQGYDSYIKKYENFNKQVNEYLLNRKVPDNLANPFLSKYDSANSHSLELHDGPDDASFRKNKTSVPARNSINYSPKSEMSKSSITSDGQESPIKGLIAINEETQPIQSEDDLMKFKYQCNPSLIYPPD